MCGGGEQGGLIKPVEGSMCKKKRMAGIKESAKRAWGMLGDMKNGARSRAGRGTMVFVQGSMVGGFGADSEGSKTMNTQTSHWCRCHRIRWVEYDVGTRKKRSAF